MFTKQSRRAVHEQRRVREFVAVYNSPHRLISIFGIADVICFQILSNYPQVYHKPTNFIVVLSMIKIYGIMEIQGHHLTRQRTNYTYHR